LWHFYREKHLINFKRIIIKRTSLAASLSSQKVRLNKLRCKEEKKNELKQIRPLINSGGKKTSLPP